MSEMTIADVGKALSKYRPFIAMVVAVALVVVVLPGKPGPKNDQTVATGTSRGPAVNTAALAQDGAATDVATTDDATAVTDASGTTAVGAGGTVGGSAGKPAAAAPKAGSSGAAATGAAAPTGSSAAAASGPGPDCDTRTGRIKMPTVYAFPCVPPFSGDNGGATYKQGVTGDTITVVLYVGQPDPTSQAILAAGGDNDTQDQIIQQYQEYVDLFNAHTELYGRKVKMVTYNGTGKADDQDAGKADAIKVATEKHAFMSWGSPNNAYLNELRARGVLCVCTTTLPRDFYLEHAPFVWGNGLPDENQAYLMRAEMIGKQMAYQGGDPSKPAKAKYAGDPVLQTKDRKFGLIYYETADKAYAAGEKFFEEELAKYNVHLADKAAYVFDTTTAQQDSKTIISKFASEGITSIVFVGDPIYPVFYTAAATNQNYQPEWIVTGSALTDTTFFARTYDKTQWAHAFGLSLLAARGPKNSGDAYTVYNWHYGRDPVAPGSYGTLYPTVMETFMGLHLAGPHLDPNSFRDGMFAFPISPAKGGITKPLISFGRQLWNWDDYNLYDDSTEIYWDNTAQGPDELDKQGVGMYRFIAGGKRYLPGQFAKEDFKAFDANGTVLVYDKLPAQDQPPDSYNNPQDKKGYH